MSANKTFVKNHLTHFGEIDCQSLTPENPFVSWRRNTCSSLLVQKSQARVGRRAVASSKLIRKNRAGLHRRRDPTRQGTQCRCLKHGAACCTITTLFRWESF